MHYPQLNNNINAISQKGGGFMNKFKKSLIALTISLAVVNVNLNYSAAGSAANVYLG